MNAIKQDSSLYKIVVTHYLCSALCFLGLAVMLLCSSDILAGHYFHPHILAITHLAALGWGTLVIFGASYQLVPVVLETDLYSKKLAWLSFALFLPGALTLVISFWQFDPGLPMQCAGILISAAVLLFTANIFLTARKKKRATIQEDFISSACLCLCFTVLLGTALVYDFRYAYLPQGPMHFLKLHAHLGIVGWFLLLTIGVSSKLVPMFLVSSYQNTRLLNWSYYLIVGALLLFIIDSYFFGINYKTYVWTGMGIAGIACYLFFVRKCFISRLRKRMDVPMAQTFLSFVFLMSAVFTAPFIIYYHLKNDPAALHLTVFYGCLIFMGWITSLILGQAFKTLPFIVWVKHYEHLTGKVKTPMPSDLFKGILLNAQTGSFILFCLIFFPGCFSPLPVFKYAGLIALMATAVFYVVNIVIILLHKTQTEPYDHV